MYLMRLASAFNTAFRNKAHCLSGSSVNSFFPVCDSQLRNFIKALRVRKVSGAVPPARGVRSARLTKQQVVIKN